MFATIMLKINNQKGSINVITKEFDRMANEESQLNKNRMNPYKCHALCKRHDAKHDGKTWT